jgi:hypothetical protein
MVSHALTSVLWIEDQHDMDDDTEVARARVDKGTGMLVKGNEERD